MTANTTALPTNCPVLRDAFHTINAIAVEAVWLPNRAMAITLAQAQTALRDLHHRLQRVQDLRVFETAVTAYVSTLRSSMQDGDTPLCDTARTRLAQATELLELVRNQTRTVVDPADPWRGMYHRVASRRATPTARSRAIPTCLRGPTVARYRYGLCSLRKASTCPWLRANSQTELSDLMPSAPRRSCTTGTPTHPGRTCISCGWARPRTASLLGSCGRWQSPQ